MRVLFVFLAFLISCGSEEPYMEKDIQNEDLGMVYDEFMDRCQDEGLCQIENYFKFTVKYGHIEKDTVLGICRKWTNGKREIIIRPELKGRALMEVVMYHELGHCLLNLGHHEDETDIMNPYVMTYYEFSTKKEHYVSKMFARGKKVIFLAPTEDKTLPPRLLNHSHTGNCIH